MNPQQEAIALWKFYETRGFKPSVRSIGRALRDQGLKFSETDLRSWLKLFSVASPTQPRRDKREETSQPRRNAVAPSRANNVSLVSKVMTPIGVRKAKRAMKQPALALGAVAPPEIDFDRRRLDMVDGLPDSIPEPIDDLRELAKVFAVAFGYLKNSEKIRKATPIYADVLAGMRKSGVTVERAWQAFRDAVIAREGQPLVGSLPKTAYSYLGNGRRPFAAANAPRFDSCKPGCKLPDGVFMPRLGPTDTAHWDGDQWLYGDIRDVR